MGNGDFTADAKVSAFAIPRSVSQHSPECIAQTCTNLIPLRNHPEYSRGAISRSSLNDSTALQERNAVLCCKKVSGMYLMPLVPRSCPHTCQVMLSVDAKYTAAGVAPASRS